METEFPGRHDQLVGPPAIRKIAKSDLAIPIRILLAKFFSISCRVIYKKLRIGKVIYVRIFHEEFNFNKLYHRLIPYFLDKSEKYEQIVFSEQRREVLATDRRNSFENMFTSDES
jgi:hypothetical protein